MFVWKKVGSQILFLFYFFGFGLVFGLCGVCWVVFLFWYVLMVVFCLSVVVFFVYLLLVFISV